PGKFSIDHPSSMAAIEVEFPKYVDRGELDLRDRREWPQRSAGLNVQAGIRDRLLDLKLEKPGPRGDQFRLVKLTLGAAAVVLLEPVFEEDLFPLGEHLEVNDHFVAFSRRNQKVRNARPCVAQQSPLGGNRRHGKRFARRVGQEYRVEARVGAVQKA